MSRQPGHGGTDPVQELARDLQAVFSDPVAIKAVEEDAKPVYQCSECAKAQRGSDTEKKAMSNGDDVEETEILADADFAEEDGDEMEDGDIPKEGDEEEEEVVDLGVLNDVQEQVFEEVKLPEDIVDEARSSWEAFIQASRSRDAAGEAIYAALFDAAPSLQSLFKTPRSVMAMRFMNGLNSIMNSLKHPPGLK
ncbi:unnamed protein product, partial [Symbiodinium microadriaticum]